MPTLAQQLAALIAAADASDVSKAASDANAIAERNLRVTTERDFAAYKLAHPATGTPVVPPVPTVPTPSPSAMPAVERNGTRTPIAPRLSPKLAELGPQTVPAGKTIDFGGKLLSGLNVQPGGFGFNFRFKSESALKVEDDGTIEDYEILDGSKYGVEFSGRFTSRRGIIGDVSQHSLIGGDCIWAKIEDLDVRSALYQSSLRWARADGYMLRVRVRAPTTKSTARGGTLTAKGIWIIDCDIEGAGTYGAGNPLGQRDGGDGRGIKEFNVKGGGVKYADGAKWDVAYATARATPGTREQQVAATAAACGVGNVDIAKTLAVRDSLLNEFGNVYHVNTRIKVPLIAIEAGGLMDFDGRPESKIVFSRGTYPEWKLNGDPSRRGPQLVIAGQAVAL